jgi:hypothetical protein
MKGDNLSHEEVWDDSALQDSWDDALAEYKVCRPDSLFIMFNVLTQSEEIP